MLKWLTSDIPVKVDVKGNLSERNLKYFFKEQIIDKIAGTAKVWEVLVIF